MSDFHGKVGAPSESVSEYFRDKIRGFIFPNTPRTEDEIAAFNKAVIYQYEHEATRRQQMNDNSIQQGVTSFRIGDFSMNFEDGTNDANLTMKTICPAAYSVLLHAGLLYKGVERGPDYVLD